MTKYNHQEIEHKWQAYWEEQELFKTPTDATRKNKMYILPQWPYPSGAGLHVGHAEVYTACDIYARYQRLAGKKVLQVMGWDAFGLPAENYAIKNNVHPRKSTDQAIDNFRSQIKSLGISVDWEREVGSHNVDYYKWTQWFFLLFYKRGLAYRKKQAVNWCDSCKTVLANEQVTTDGKCERCSTEIVQRQMEQWYLRITDYAERLLEGLDKIDWPEETKKRQRDWIGKSEGAELEFLVRSPESGVKSKKCLVIHGIGGHKRENWFPWLKKALEPQGWQVNIPSLPTPDHPVVAEWNDLLLKELSADSVVVGHSLGAPAALNLVQTAGKKIKKLILVAPVNPNQDWAHLKSAYSYADWDAVKSFADLPFTWEKINQLAEEIFIYYSDNDKYIPQKSVDFYKQKLPRAVFKFVSGKGHFNEPSGVTEFPEILEAITPRIKVFTTRPDTLFGATYLVLAPESSYVQNLKGQISNWQEVEKYINATKLKTDLDRQIEKVKTGVELQGVKAINPATGKEIPIYIADYVLSGYGTGAIMAVPAHDERDWEFAKKFNLPIVQVIAPMVGPNIEKDLPKADKETVRRKNVYVLVKHWQDDAYYCLDWKKFGWRSFVIGGVEPRETWDAAAVRETAEETGYQNIKSIKQIGGEIHSHYFAEHKNVNRYAESLCYLIELADGARAAEKDIDTENHVGEWVPAKKVALYINLSSHQWYWGVFIEGEEAFVGDGVIINSGEFDGLSIEEAKKKITAKVGGKIVTRYKLRDWSVSRQRFWGAPIPILYDDKGELQAVPEKDLPVILPDDVDFKPTGESPLNYSKSFNAGVEEKYGKGWHREPDTLDTFMCSSWYYYRYLDPKNDKQFASPKSLKAWMPVDFYLGGPEHVNGHLLYARFFTKVLFDAGYIDFDEPFLKHRHQGLILGEDNRKMSKRWGNSINPTDVANEYGADTFRIYEMFMGPLEQDKPWDTNGVKGVRRFLERVWKLQEKVQNQESGIKNQESISNIQYPISGIDRLVHKTIKKVGEDIEALKFNTAVSALMILVNEMEKQESISISNIQYLITILSPFAPHLAEELWQKLGHPVKSSSNHGAGKKSITLEAWPKYDKKLVIDENIKLVVQVNGKLREMLEVPASISEAEATKLALASEKVKVYVTAAPKKVIFVPGKLINLVV